MIDRVDLLIAVIGIVVSVLGSSTAMWVALSKKPDRADLNRVESRIESRIERLESRLENRAERVETRLERVEGHIELLEGHLGRVESKLDSVIARLLPETGS
jgi:hypothetical protein